MKLSDWLLGTYDGVACTSGWLCSCLLSLGVFWLIFSDSWCRNHYFICCFLMFDHEITLIGSCAYFRATIYCTDLSPTVFICCFDYKSSLTPFLFCFYFPTFLFVYFILFFLLFNWISYIYFLLMVVLSVGIFSLFYRSYLSVWILFSIYRSYLSVRTFAKNCIASGISSPRRDFNPNWWNYFG